MYNNYNNGYNNTNYTNQLHYINQQQLIPPVRVPDGGRPPRREGQPMTAPPDFTPELPDTLRQPFGGPDQQFGPGQQFRPGQPFGMPGRQEPRQQFDFRRMRGITGCVNRFTFIWLVNGNRFWFYPIFVGGQQVAGFRWSRGSWIYDRISIRRILYFQCF